ncbi:hypothetical protein ACJJTC_017148 [Scirpophaga incertulas]
MAWFSDLAGKAENLLNNIDEQTGAALRNHVVKSKKHNQNVQPNQVLRQKRSPLSSNKKAATANDLKSNNISPVRQLSPTSNSQIVPCNSRKRSPVRKPNAHYSLDNYPKTLVRDNESDAHFGLRKRRASLPADLEILQTCDLTYRMQNLEVENAMLKNELNVMNREVSELLARLRQTEEGKFVVNSICKELRDTQMKLERTEFERARLGLETKSHNTQLEQLKQKIHDLTSTEMLKQREISESLETDVCFLKKRNKELEEQIKDLNEKTNENNSIQIKTETELRHAQSVIAELQANLERSTSECRRMETDWEAYKLRVKGMLYAKDKEIKDLQQGVIVSEDAKTLRDQLDKLQEEREELSQAVSQVRSESEGMKEYIKQLETKHAGTERVVTALRDALRDERAAKNKVEVQNLALGKELQMLQFDSGQMIAELHASLRDKEIEMVNLRNSLSARTIDSSALNVADYDSTPAIDEDRLHCLTQKLVQKQQKIDSLLADNNILRIQLDKLESKLKQEVLAARNNNHVVHLQESERRTRSFPSGLAARLVLMMKRHSLFRTFLIIYMICLHLWVLAVLFTSTPDGNIARQVKL